MAADVVRRRRPAMEGTSHAHERLAFDGAGGRDRGRRRAPRTPAARLWWRRRRRRQRRWRQRRDQSRQEARHAARPAGEPRRLEQPRQRPRRDPVQPRQSRLLVRRHPRRVRGRLERRRECLRRRVANPRFGTGSWRRDHEPRHVSRVRHASPLRLGLRRPRAGRQCAGRNRERAPSDPGHPVRRRGSASGTSRSSRPRDLCVAAASTASSSVRLASWRLGARV